MVYKIKKITTSRIKNTSIGGGVFGAMLYLTNLEFFHTNSSSSTPPREHRIMCLAKGDGCNSRERL